MSFQDDIKWNSDGLVPVITQDNSTKEILMMAWMNSTALKLTVEKGHAVYWSRSRKKLWHKGEESGNQQIIHQIRLDCDQDVILLMVTQKNNIACHTGRTSCFFHQLIDRQWVINQPIIKDPKEIYHKKHE